MTRRLAVVAAGLAAAASFAAPQPASACTIGLTCQYLNIVCTVATGSNCV